MFVGQLQRRASSPNRVSQRASSPEKPSESSCLDLAHSGVTPDQVPAVLKVVTLTPTLKTLNLSGNLLNDDAVTELVHALLKSTPPCGLELLDLSNNPALTWRCAEGLSVLLGNADDEALTRLGFSGKAAFRKVTEGLKCLKLESLGLGDKGVRQMVGALRRNSSLKVCACIRESCKVHVQGLCAHSHFWMILCVWYRIRLFAFTHLHAFVLTRISSDSQMYIQMRTSISS